MKMPVEGLTVRRLTRSEPLAHRVELQRFLCRAIAGGDSVPSVEVESEVNETLDTACRSRGYATYVAETDCLIGVLIADHTPPSAAWLRWIAVDEDLRRRGIATVLLDRFVGDVAEGPVAGRVNSQDLVACGFWTAQGWAPRQGRENIWDSWSSGR